MPQPEEIAPEVSVEYDELNQLLPPRPQSS
jgi:hypothetical protein